MTAFQYSGESIPSSRNSKCKCPGAGVCLENWRTKRRQLWLEHSKEGGEEQEERSKKSEKLGVGVMQELLCHLKDSGCDFQLRKISHQRVLCTRQMAWRGGGKIDILRVQIYNK